MKLGDNRNKKEVRSEEERFQNRGACRRSFDAIVGRVSVGHLDKPDEGHALRELPQVRLRVRHEPPDR